MSKKNRNANQTQKTNKKSTRASVAQTAEKETAMTEQTTATNESTETAAPASESGPRTFTMIRINKYGNVLYRVEGVRATVAISKTLFAGDPPKTIVVDAANFAVPGESRTVLSPEKIAKMQETKRKTEERLAKLQERLNKINAKVGATPAESAGENTEGAAAAL